MKKLSPELYLLSIQFNSLTISIQMYKFYENGKKED